MNTDYNARCSDCPPQLSHQRLEQSLAQNTSLVNVYQMAEWDMLAKLRFNRNPLRMITQLTEAPALLRGGKKITEQRLKWASFHHIALVYVLLEILSPNWRTAWQGVRPQGILIWQDLLDRDRAVKRADPICHPPNPSPPTHRLEWHMRREISLGEMKWRGQTDNVGWRMKKRRDVPILGWEWVPLLQMR